MRGKIILHFLSYFTRKGGSEMAKLESKFQKELMDKIRMRYPGCVIIKNDSGYIQGFPDWTILYKDKWAVLETKREKNATHQPNQDYYVMKLDSMSFSRFVYPENEDDILTELSKIFDA